MWHDRAEVVSLTNIGWLSSYQATLPTLPTLPTCSEVLKLYRYISVTNFGRCLRCAKQMFFFNSSRFCFFEIFEIAAAAVWIATRKATECTHPFCLNLANFGHLAMCIENHSIKIDYLTYVSWIDPDISQRPGWEMCLSHVEDKYIKVFSWGTRLHNNIVVPV